MVRGSGLIVQRSWAQSSYSWSYVQHQQVSALSIGRGFLWWKRTKCNITWETSKGWCSQSVKTVFTWLTCEKNICVGKGSSRRPCRLWWSWATDTTQCEGGPSLKVDLEGRDCGPNLHQQQLSIQRDEDLNRYKKSHKGVEGYSQQILVEYNSKRFVSR